jgi:HAD superfamily hydrolase (TIGR01509 family)
VVVAILDIDGTLVDTNYQHALAWFRAFRDNGIVLPVWRIHRHIGMGGDQVIPALCGEETEERLGEKIRDAESEHYFSMIEEVETMDASRELIEALSQRGHSIILASSAKEKEVDHYLDLLDARELADAWTTSADVEETKPEPDLVKAALARAGAPAQDAVMIGDTTWDVEAAGRAGVRTITVRTGGFGADELRQAGAIAIYESVRELLERLDDTPLR